MFLFAPDKQPVISQETGNVLFLILIAVALFAALSYAVTNSSRTGDGAISSEKAKLYAAQIIQLGTQMETGITRMRLNGSKDYGLDLTSPYTYYNTANGTCASNACKLFDSEGGGAIPILLDERMFDTSLAGASGPAYRKYVFRSISVLDVGSDIDELVLMIHVLNKNICTEINKKLGIIDGGEPPTEAFTGYVNYNATLTSFPEGTGVLGDEAAIFKGKRAFCAYHSITYGYTYYQVLMPR